MVIRLFVYNGVHGLQRSLNGRGVFREGFFFCLLNRRACMQKIKFPTTLWVGADALQGLRDLSSKKSFVVTDPFMVQSGMINQVIENLEHTDVTIFSDIVPDPPTEVVAAGVNQVLDTVPDIIVAVGGGSAIDAAKAMLYFSKRVDETRNIKFIAVPTTSGTGSEVTNFSVITVAESGVKHPLVTDDIQPDIAILDTRLVMSVPPTITADTGMDVLVHLIESYVSTNENVMAKALVEYAIQLVFTYLPEAYAHGDNVEAREQMHIASCMAGMAFNLTNLGLNHGLAHALGGRFHIPHGRINAILLPHIVAFNGKQEHGSNETAQRYTRLANIIGATTTSNSRIGVTALVRKIKQLQQAVKMPTTLSACGFERNEVLAVSDEIAKAALADACTSANPKLPTVSDIKALLEAIV